MRRIHEVERAVPLISASALHATTLARQPCRNLARMLALRLKNLAYFLFFPRLLLPFSLETTIIFLRNRSRFPSRKLRIVAYPSSRGRDSSSKASRMPPRRHYTRSHQSAAHAGTAASLAYSRRNRVWRYGSIAQAAATASHMPAQQHHVCCYNSSLKSSAVRAPTRKRCGCSCVQSTIVDETPERGTSSPSTTGTCAANSGSTSASVWGGFFP